jgi:DNA topoisomerase-1
VTDAIREVANQLRNTIAVCRKCYVHPDVIHAYLAGALRAAVPHPQRACCNC